MCFYPLTRLFFSTLNDEAARIFQEEMWGLIKFVGLSYDEAHKIPVHERRYYIYKHNEYQAKLKEDMEKARNGGK